jgi:hypothetical protein
MVVGGAIYDVKAIGMTASAITGVVKNNLHNGGGGAVGTGALGGLGLGSGAIGCVGAGVTGCGDVGNTGCGGVWIGAAPVNTNS